MFALQNSQDKLLSIRLPVRRPVWIRIRQKVEQIPNGTEVITRAKECLADMEYLACFIFIKCGNPRIV